MKRHAKIGMPFFLYKKPRHADVLHSFAPAYAGRIPDPEDPPWPKPIASLLKDKDPFLNCWRKTAVAASRTQQGNFLIPQSIFDV